MKKCENCGTEMKIEIVNGVLMFLQNLDERDARTFLRLYLKALSLSAKEKDVIIKLVRETDKRI